MKIDVTYEEEDIGGGETVEKLVIRLGDANPDGKLRSGSDTALLVDGVYATQLSVGTIQGGMAAVANYDADANPEDMYNIVLSELKDSKDRAWSETTEILQTEFDTAKASGAATFAGNNQDEFQVDNEDGTVTTYTKTTTNNRANNGTTTTYTKTVTSQSYILDDNDLYGSLQSIRELLTEAGEFTPDATVFSIDENASTKRGIPYYQKALDMLANQIATQFNKLNQGGYVVNADGNYVDEDGNEIQYNGAPMSFSSDLTADQIKCLKDNRAVPVEDSGVLFSNSGDGNETDGITAANISIAKGWADKSVHLVKSYTETVPGDGVPTTASDNLDHFVALMSKRLDYDNDKGDTLFHGSFQEMLTDISANLANDIRSSNVKLEAYQNAATELDTSRESVSGVDLNDEAMNMIQYQKAYSAACRLMTVLDEALEKLINGTGVAGL
jgi:flagellar hook-associated protein 1 FlgK